MNAMPKHWPDYAPHSMHLTGLHTIRPVISALTMAVTTAYACVRVLAESVASLTAKTL